MAGEHAVVRGAPALVFPLESARLSFAFDPKGSANKDIELELTGPNGPELDLLFWGVLEKACALTGVRRPQLEGRVRINNQIPVGAGLGASAAFCVAVARWFQAESLIPMAEIETFARELENLFHGESSGVDIAVAHGGKPIKFQRGAESQVLDLKWKPKCFLTYSGQRGVTRECVNKVKDLWVANPTEAEKWDQNMKLAVANAEAALLMAEAEGYPVLVKAFGQAADSFRAWNLFDHSMDLKARSLLARGADVVKPTGSGGGGFLLSLWSEPPTASEDLLPCFGSLPQAFENQKVSVSSASK